MGGDWLGGSGGAMDIDYFTIHFNTGSIYMETRTVVVREAFDVTNERGTAGGCC